MFIKCDLDTQQFRGTQKINETSQLGSEADILDSEEIHWPHAMKY